MWCNARAPLTRSPVEHVSFHAASGAKERCRRTCARESAFASFIRDFKSWKDTDG
jgi:hypothetical protein